MAQDQTIVQGKVLNEPNVHTKHYHSTFPLGAPRLGTYRFGEYGVIFADENIEKDSFTWRLPHEIRSFMLKAPLMQNMKLHKDMFWVPKMAIIPNSWEKLNIIPERGDTAPDNADTMVLGFDSKIAGLTRDLATDIIADIENLISENKEDTGISNTILKLALWCEMFYSRGSLLNACGYPMGAYWTNNDATNKTNLHKFGYWFDKIINKLFDCSDRYTLTIGEDSYSVYKTEEECIKQKSMSIRTALCKMRDDFRWQIEANPTEETQDFTWFEDDNNWWNVSLLVADEERPFNYERLVAYQIACAHYYTNDKIDFVYTAQLYRELISSYVLEYDNTETYTYNGITVLYDWLSGQYMDILLQMSLYENLNENALWAYYRAIFGFNRSLRFKDYFTGSRANPLTVGEYKIPVNDNEVSVIDVTKSILWQKMGNALQKVGNRLEKQKKQLMGVDMKPDYHNPFWLGHTEDSIGTPETQGTGEAVFDESLRNGAKLPVASEFRSAAGRMQFSASLDREGIVLAIMYFEIPRLYVNSVERFWYFENQFDKFNTYLQFTGDQPVSIAELDITKKMENTFGYQGKHMEYKQKVGVAWGGFVNDLPGWCFIADNTRNGISMETIGPSYIRSLQTEVDELFQSLNGYSLDTYYHFICKHNLENVAHRAMAARPGILNG